jgi:hypothetical protein
MPVLRSVTQYESSRVHSLLGILSKRFWSVAASRSDSIRRVSLNTSPVFESPWEMNSPILPAISLFDFYLLPRIL